MAAIEIRCGDALEELKKLEDGSVALIISDPPYNLGKDYGNGSDQFDFDEYIEFSRSWLCEACRILKPGGSIYVFMGMRYIAYVYALMEREFGLSFRSWITWFYTQGLGKTRGFSPRHDDILMFSKPGGNITFNLDAIRVPQKCYRSVNNMRGANPGNVWEFSHIHYCNKNRRAHPTQKPEALYERMILASSNPGDLVIDPFAGSGTLLRVCQQLQRRAVGIEVNPNYVEMIKERLQEPFSSFDSFDERITRIPAEMEKEMLKGYVVHHIEWFLQGHKNLIPRFLKDMREKYGEDYYAL